VSLSSSGNIGERETAEFPEKGARVLGKTMRRREAVDTSAKQGGKSVDR